MALAWQMAAAKTSISKAKWRNVGVIGGVAAGESRLMSGEISEISGIMKAINGVMAYQWRNQYRISSIARSKRYAANAP